MIRADSNRQRSDFGKVLFKVRVAERPKYEAQSKVGDGRASSPKELVACMQLWTLYTSYNYDTYIYIQLYAYIFGCM